MKNKRFISKTIALLILAFGFSKANAQVGIGTPGTVEASAALEVSSSTKGFFVPRMTTTQKQAITNAKSGLMIFDSTTKVHSVYLANTAHAAYNSTNWGDILYTTRNQTVFGSKTFNAAQTFAGANTFSGVNTFSGGATFSGGTVNFSGATVSNLISTSPMGELGFVLATPSTQTAKTVATPWPLTNTDTGTSTSTGWKHLIFPAVGTTVGSSTFKDTVAGVAARVRGGYDPGMPELIYVGSTARRFRICLNYSILPGDNQKYFAFGIFKNNVLLPESVSYVGAGTINFNGTSFAIEQLSLNDVLSVRFLETTGTNANFVLRSANFTAVAL